MGISGRHLVIFGKLSRTKRARMEILFAVGPAAAGFHEFLTFANRREPHNTSHFKDAPLHFQK